MAGVRNRVASAIPTAVYAPAAGVSAPASKLTTEREKPPVTGMPPEKPAPRLAVPRPISSWLGSFRWRRFGEDVCRASAQAYVKQKGFQLRSGEY